MMRIISAIIASVVAINIAATPAFNNDEHYRIVCQQFPAGQVCDGSWAGQSTPLYYLNSTNNSNACYWTISEESQGLYSIRNVYTGQYVTYDGVRADDRRYVSMTSQMNGSYSLWTINLEGDGSYTIRNASKTDHIWDVRVDSYMVGTYSNSGSGNQNQLFRFYDEQGTAVNEVFTISDPLDSAAPHLTIGSHTPVYAASNNIYLCSIPADCFNNDFTATVSYDMIAGNSQLRIDGTSVDSGSSYTFANVTGGKNYSLSITQADGTTISKNLTFTSLPVVRIFGSFGYNYTPGHIVVYEPDETTADIFQMKAKWRGGITNGSDKHKRNYHVKLVNDNGEKLDHKFFGLRDDNSWILESCQVDMLRIRNRVLTDLWNDYSTPPYYADLEPKARSGSRGVFVELILNDEYRGIYCMTEAIDRKQMKLKKYDETTGTMHGMLWKSKDWSYAVFMGHNSNSNYYPGTSPVSFNNYSESWDQYYVKYPDIDDVNPTDWQALYNAVNFVCTSNDLNFIKNVANYFDIPVLIDYYILMEVILSTDNHGKNMYFAIYDKQEDPRITFAVWDMDATTGQRWSDAYYHWSGMNPEQDYAQYIINNEHGDYNLFRRMRNTNAEDFNMRVRLRYRDLRSSYLSTASLLNRFHAYIDAFTKCGADKREYAKWNGDTDINSLSLNFNTELNYLDNWLTRRLNYLDNTRFKISELPPSAIYDITLDDNRQHSDDNTPRIYDLQGRSITAPQKPGIYIIDGKKRVIR